MGEGERLIEEWYSRQPKHRLGFPPRGTISGALVVLNRLQEEFDLRLSFHTSVGGTQIKGASGNKIKKILASFGEDRPFVKEGGRTNRGLVSSIIDLLSMISESRICSIERDLRNQELVAMQQFLISRIADIHALNAIDFEYDESLTTRALIAQILRRARDRDQSGAVAQHLVGAKLEIRFPDSVVENYSSATADVQTGRAGDFTLGDTCFHVTIQPMSPVYDKCLANLKQGLRPYLLVPEEILAAAKTNANSTVKDRISVKSIEAFVGGNVDELSGFRRGKQALKFGELLRAYNARVQAAETDMSLKILTPAFLETEGSADNV